MHKEKKRLAAGLSLGILTALILACVPPAFAQPTADSFGVEDSSDYKDTYVTVPVTVTNAQHGPIICIIFDIAYDKNVINVVDVQQGDLTSTWDPPAFNNFDWGTRVLIVYDGNNGIQNGASGSVVLLNFRVIGMPESTSIMALSNIQFSDTGYTVGTAPAKNGTFSILSSPGVTPSPTTGPPAGGGGGGGGGLPLATPPNVPVDPATGAVRSTTTLTADGATLTIPAGTIIKDAEGKPLARITIGYVPTIAERAGAINAYDYGPSGATFTPPIDLVIEYDLADILEGFSQSDLVIRMWDGTEWIDLETTIDTIAHTATAKVSHFTLFALFAAPPVSLTLPPEVTPIPLPVVTPTPSPTPPVPVVRMVVVIAMLIAVLIAAVAYMVLRGRM